MSGFLNQNRVWVDLESERSERLLLEVWNSLPEAIRRPLEDRVVKIYDEPRYPEHVHPDFNAQCEFRPWGCEIFLAEILMYLPEDAVRFTIAHELGHAFLHFGKNLQDKASMRKAQREANGFATAFGYSRTKRQRSKNPVRQGRTNLPHRRDPKRIAARANDTPTKAIADASQ
jgi:predicted Zn-dependent protease with MMP-like domain